MTSTQIKWRCTVYHYKRDGVREKEMICLCEDEDLVSRDSSAPRKVLFWDSRSGCSPIHGSDEELYEFMKRLGDEPAGVCFLDLMG